MIIEIVDADIHPHLRARMNQRGVHLEEIQRVMNDGWPTTDSKQGTSGKAFIFNYAAEWEGQFYPEKEVTVYYKVIDEEIVLLTVKARYGQGFTKG